MPRVFVSAPPPPAVAELLGDPEDCRGHVDTERSGRLDLGVDEPADRLDWPAAG